LADLVVFTRQLATMIDAGLAMVQSLQALAEQTTNKVMRDVIKDICARVEAGDSFSEALQKHPKAFSRLYVCMVAAGKRAVCWRRFWPVWRPISRTPPALEKRSSLP
jgi:type IV pilus assembly protein PilC